MERTKEVALHAAVYLAIAGFVAGFWGAVIYGCTAL